MHPARIMPKLTANVKTTQVSRSTVFCSNILLQILKNQLEKLMMEDIAKHTASNITHKIHRVNFKFTSIILSFNYFTIIT